MKHIQSIGLGGGCHWCTEAVFQQLNGVSNVRQGYIKSVAPYENWSEAVLLDYDPAIMTIEHLVDVHLETHASTVNHQRRNSYRSAIYYFDENQRDIVKMVMSSLSRKRDKSYISQLLEFVGFKESRESIQNYYRTRPDAPFCKRYIAPKLELVEAMKTDQLK